MFDAKHAEREALADIDNLFKLVDQLKWERDAALASLPRDGDKCAPCLEECVTRRYTALKMEKERIRKEMDRICKYLEQGQ